MSRLPNDRPAFCPILGIPINYEVYGLECSASLDRIDSGLGYVDGNVRWVSTRANRLKSNATLNELFLLGVDSMCLSEWQTSVEPLE